MPSNLWQTVARNKNWRIGRTTPNNAVGTNGEFWLNDLTGDLWEKVNGVYVSVPVPSGGGGAVDSVFGRTGHVVAQSGDYNATQVGLGNVTNDAQLKRSANDFTSFAPKVVPVESDVIIIEDSAASGVKKYTTIGAALGADQLYLAKPITPNTFDDEFNFGSPDVATRGWLFRNMTTGVIMSRVGDVYPYQHTWLGGVGALTPNQYRSRIESGRLVIQLTAGNGPHEYALYKPVTFPTATNVHGGVIWSRFGSSRALESGNQHGFTNVSMWADNGGLPDLSNRNYHQLFYQSNNSYLTYVGVNSGAYTDTSITLGDTSPDDTFGIMTCASNTIGTKFFRLDTGTGADSSAPWKTGTQWKSAGHIAYAGMGFYIPNPSTETHQAGLRHIDFIRLRTGDMRDLCATSQWLYP